MITIYEARKILTMNPARPVATHVAAISTAPIPTEKPGAERRRSKR
jgi:hypothetical protein